MGSIWRQTEGVHNHAECQDTHKTILIYVKYNEVLFLCVVQQQYEFIHCGLSELVVCGETEVAAANLRIAVINLKKMGEDGMTGFQKQMKVW